MIRRPQPTFMELVELHERVWGTERYPLRPKLTDILESPVVVFWKSTESNDNRYTITLHKDMSEVEKYFLRIFFISQEPAKKRVVRIYLHQKRMMVKAVKVMFAPSED